MLTEIQLSRLQDLLGEKPEVAAAYLFGSEAAGRYRRGSDVDVALILTNRLSGMGRIDLETELSNAIGRDVDLVVFSEASPLLQHQILKYGILVYEANRGERIRQEVAARRHYFDTKFLHRELRA